MSEVTNMKEFKKALKILDIEDYADDIWNSNSTGELHHIADYIYLSEIIVDPKWFRGFFELMVKKAYEHWKRPQSVYQHVLSHLEYCINQGKSSVDLIK